MSEEIFWSSSSEQKAKRDKKTAPKNNYNILFWASKASEETFWLSYCRLKNKMDKKTEPKYNLKLIFYVKRARKIC